MDNPLVVDVKKLAKYIAVLPMAKQLNSMSNARREAMIKLRDSASAVQDSIVKYAVSDDTAEQAELLHAGLAQTSRVNEAILEASLHDLLDPADVAHLSALAEQIKERLA